MNIIEILLRHVQEMVIYRFREFFVGDRLGNSELVMVSNRDWKFNQISAIKKSFAAIFYDFIIVTVVIDLISIT